MTRTKKTVLWIIAVIALAYGWFHLSFPTAQFNYKLTLEADTPDGPKTGSTVISLDFGSQFDVNGGGRRHSLEVSGEALYLDLGRGKNLFVTLTEYASGREGRGIGLDGANSPIWLPKNVLSLKWQPGEERELARQVLAAKAAGPEDVPFLALPTTVTFGNMADPKSVALVDPRNLSATFGPGYELKSATIEITDEPVTRGIAKVLPWMADNRAAPLGTYTNRENREFYRKLTQREFQTYGDGQ